MKNIREGGHQGNQDRNHDEGGPLGRIFAREVTKVTEIVTMMRVDRCEEYSRGRSRRQPRS